MNLKVCVSSMQTNNMFINMEYFLLNSNFLHATASIYSRAGKSTVLSTCRKYNPGLVNSSHVGSNISGCIFFDLVAMKIGRG